MTVKVSTKKQSVKQAKGRKYYARVRSYKKSGKKMLYGAWSAAKLSGKVKK